MDNKNNKVVLFEGRKIRSVDYNGQLYYNLADVIEVLTDSKNPNAYWRKLKQRLLDEGANEVVTNCHALKYMAKDGKNYTQDGANTEGVLRIIMSVPSPKAEPFKQWLAQVGEEKIQETENPELGFERLRELYKSKGYPEDWIEQRLKSIDIRKQLTNEWQKRGITEGVHFSHLTAEIAQETFGVSPTQHAQLKGLKKENLRDHMTDLELVFTMLGEVITKNLAEKDDSQGFMENMEAAQRGGSYAGTARENLEKKESLKVVSTKSFLHLKTKDTTDELPEKIE